MLGKPFVQVDGAPDTVLDGSGLGLSICMALTKMHGGSLNIESELSKGTSVHVTLPYRTVTEELQEMEILAA